MSAGQGGDHERIRDPGDRAVAGAIDLERASRRRLVRVWQVRLGGAWPLTAKRVFGAVAQLGERLVCNQEVAGSNPVGSTRRTKVSRGIDSVRNRATVRGPAGEAGRAATLVRNAPAAIFDK